MPNPMALISLLIRLLEAGAINAIEFFELAKAVSRLL